ncbi:hypothetical protein FQN57_005816 [Myotisia sp. PD_48]|nr:hypothetical protein FQN57_005816 [Myotisia sp. PD_48]
MESLSQSRDCSPHLRFSRSETSMPFTSLAQLSPRFQTDNDLGDVGYFSSSHQELAWTDSTHHAHQPHYPASSYLSTTSVPSTPGLLSTSRNVSHVNLAKRRITPKGLPKSETNLNSLNTKTPLHHHPHTRHHQRAKSYTPRPKNHASSGTTTPHPPDSEWLLRAGLALASTTREEKGQSWLEKRESSTSLVSEQAQGDPLNIRRSEFQGQRSGLSTPVSRSRRGSTSHPASRRPSRTGLAMTPSIYSPMHRFTSQSRGERAEPNIPGILASDDGSGNGNSMSSTNDDGDATTPFKGPENSDSSHFDPSNSPHELDYLSDSQYDYDEEEEEEEVDEAEMQRLTRERGFGLGSWVDKLVERVLFGVEEEPIAPLPTTNHSWVTPQASLTQATDTVDFVLEEQDGSDVETEKSIVSDLEHPLESGTEVEPPDNEGGWTNDAKWLLHVVGNLALS